MKNRETGYSSAIVTQDRVKEKGKGFPAEPAGGGFAMNCLKKHGNGFRFDGKPVTLRGIGVGSWINLEHFMMGMPGLDGMIRDELDRRMPGLAQTVEKNFFTDADAAYLRSMGVNLVRVPFNLGRLYDAQRDAFRPEGLALLRTLGEICERHRLFFLPDMHTVPGGQNPDWHSECETGVPLFWRYEVLRCAAVRAWGKIAGELKGFRYLAGYDLLNEPVLPEGQENLLDAFHARAAEAIRQEDPDHLIFIEGNRFSMDFRGVGLPDLERSAYTYHFYPAVWDSRLGDPALPEEERQAGFRKAHERILESFGSDPGALLCGETGFELQMTGEKEGLRMLEDVLCLFESAGVSWCVWSYKDSGMMGLRFPGENSVWRKVCARIGEEWNHHLDMERGDRLAGRISREWFGGRLTEKEIYALQFRLRAALFAPEAEHILRPALETLTDWECVRLGEDFSHERCETRAGYEALLKRYCHDRKGV